MLNLRNGENGKPHPYMLQTIYIKSIQHTQAEKSLTKTDGHTDEQTHVQGKTYCPLHLK